MAIRTTPHTQTEQNTNLAETDLDANQTLDEVGRDGDEAIYNDREGAQTGEQRAPLYTDARQGERSTMESSTPASGSLKTRTPESTQQGITSHSASEESERQRKVVEDRADAQAGVDPLRKSA